MPFSPRDVLRSVVLYKLVIGIVVTAFLYTFFIWGIQTNPPGFDQDECCVGYIGYSIATTGTGGVENPTTFPLFFQCGQEGYTNFSDPVHPYALAVLFLFVSPSILSARLLVATAVFLSILLLGLLATRISGRRTVGIIVAISAMVTPWIFENGRPIPGTFLVMIFLVPFLFFLHAAYKRGTWQLIDNFLVAGTLTALTYCYSAGRVIAPILAFGLLIFAVDKQALWNVLRTWIIYAITMIPIVVVYFTKPRFLTQRFWRLTNLSSDRSLMENIGTVAAALYADISLNFFLFDGDPRTRVHIPGMGEFLAGTFALGLFGIVIILIRRNIPTWWRFILFGAFISMIPGAITKERFYALRDLAFPIFFLLLTVPAISWLLGGSWATAAGSDDTLRQPSESPTVQKKERYLRLGLLFCLLVLTAIQAANFQILFHTKGVSESRRHSTSADFPRAFDMAIQYPDRPIYIQEVGGPIFLSTAWYATEKGIDLSTNFVRLGGKELPPDGALVLTASPKGVPAGSEPLNAHSHYVIYRYRNSDTE